MLGNIVVPPDNTIFPYSSLRTSISLWRIEWITMSGNENTYFPTVFIGLNKASGHLHLWSPRETVYPEGSSYIFLLAEEFL
jgi:hypothetical protein